MPEQNWQDQASFKEQICWVGVCHGDIAELIQRTISYNEFRDCDGACCSLSPLVATAFVTPAIHSIALP